MSVCVYTHMQSSIYIYLYLSIIYLKQIDCQPKNKIYHEASLERKEKNIRNSKSPGK